jgi:TPR repeat protein
MRRLLVIGVVCLAGCAPYSAGNRGARAFRAGRYEQAFHLWKPLAEQKDVRAQTQIAYLYERGLGVTQDLTQATAWYEKAAAQGDAYAQNSLGQLYARKDPVKSLKFHKLAAEHGQAASQLALANHYRNKGEPRQAFELYQKAAGANLAEAQCRLGQIYENGGVVAQNPGLASELYRMSAEQGHPEGQYRYASLLLKTRPEEARQQMLKSAEQDYPAAQLGMARLCLARDESYEAEEWLTRAAGHGVGEAECELGKLELGRAYPDEKKVESWFRQAYGHGYKQAGVELGKLYARKSEASSEEQGWLAMAAAAGDPKAELALGRFYQDQASPSQAQSWLDRSARAGNAEAQYRLGDLLRREGKHDSWAATWYQHAAAQHYTPAYYSLGRMLEEGRGLAKDEKLAESYYQLAADAQEPLAYYALARMKQKHGWPVEGVYYYERASQAGIPDADYALGVCYQEGEGVQKDLDRARQYYLRAKIPESYYALGLLCEQDQQIEQARDYYQKAGSLPEAVQARRRLAGDSSP